MKRNCAFLILVFICSFASCTNLVRKERLFYESTYRGYSSLYKFCTSQEISWNYDTFSRHINLEKENHKATLTLNSKFVLIDGNVYNIKYPIHYYHGDIFIPYTLKRKLVIIFSKKLPSSFLKSLPKIRRIVIDPGHGGKDPGAIGKMGLKEKDIVLDISQRLLRLLKAKGFEVVMTREKDEFISLSKRAKLANEFKADLFISIHANANRSRKLRGFEVYYLSFDVDDTSRALATAENSPLDLEKKSWDENSFKLKAILWDMIYTQNRAESIRLAKIITKAISKILELKILRIKGAPFYVLKRVQMPAVLIEVGYLSHPLEEKLLNNSFYRQQLAEAISEGIVEYQREYLVKRYE